MPITSITRNMDDLTLTVAAEFPVPVARLWNAYLDPRQLERFWGPPTYPARFVRHDAFVGGRSHFFMTGPAGDTSHGYWDWLSITHRKSFEVRDGFAAADSTPNKALPSMRMRYSFQSTSRGSRVTGVTHFASAAELAQLLDMGMEEGMSAAMSQIDDVLADAATFAAEAPTTAQLLSDTQVRISRVLRGPEPAARSLVDAVWRAYHEPELLQRWMLGPDGWTMPVCHVADTVGESFRYEWENNGDRFGFEGELLESTAPFREVTTERMIGTSGETINELTLTTVPAGVLMSLVITYPDEEFRDQVLATGMPDGMEASLRRLEREVLSVL